MSDENLGYHLNVRQTEINAVTAWTIQSDLIAMTVVPELGGRIYKLVYKPLQYDVLWQNRRVPLSKIEFGSVYDDNFWGGWDELFPNDEEATFQGHRFPDHGEFWVIPWGCRPVEEEDEVGVVLKAVGPVTGVSLEKRITLRKGKPHVYFHHRLENGGKSEFPFLWKLHPCFRISRHHRIDLPPNRMRLELEYSTVIDTDIGEFDWPFCENRHRQPVDLCVVPPKESDTTLFGYGTRLQEGWFALTDRRADLGFAYSFPVSVFTACWIFASFGGWMSNYCLLLEPSSGYPSNFEEGVKAGTYPFLKPSQVIEFSSVGTFYEGLKEVTGVSADGEVSGRK